MAWEVAEPPILTNVWGGETFRPSDYQDVAFGPVAGGDKIYFCIGGHDTKSFASMSIADLVLTAEATGEPTPQPTGMPQVAAVDASWVLY